MIGPTPGELRSRRDFRLSCVAARDLAAGAVLGVDDLIFARPGTGVSPGDAHLLLGRRLARAVRSGDLLRWEDAR